MNDSTEIKDKIIEIVNDMPPGFSIEDVMERLLVLHKVETGLAQVQAGQTIPHEEVMQEAATWLA